MNHLSRMKRRQLLNGWIKWAVLPVIPFSVLFFDAWLNIQVRLKDYELATLNTETRQLENEITTQTARLSQLRGIEHLTAEALEMGLTAPNLHQFHTVAYREVPRRLPSLAHTTFEVAQTAPDPRPPLLETIKPQAAEPVEIHVATDTLAANAKENRRELSSEPGSVASGTDPNTTATELVPVEPSLVDDPEFSLLTIDDMLAKL